VKVESLRAGSARQLLYAGINDKKCIPLTARTLAYSARLFARSSETRTPSGHKPNGAADRTQPPVGEEPGLQQIGAM